MGVRNLSKGQKKTSGVYAEVGGAKIMFLQKALDVGQEG